MYYGLAQSGNPKTVITIGLCSQMIFLQYKIQVLHLQQGKQYRVRPNIKLPVYILDFASSTIDLMYLFNRGFECFYTQKIHVSYHLIPFPLLFIFTYVHLHGIVWVSGWFRWLRNYYNCLLYTSPSPRDLSTSRMPSSA